MIAQRDHQQEDSATPDLSRISTTEFPRIVWQRIKNQAILRKEGSLFRNLVLEAGKRGEALVLTPMSQGCVCCETLCAETLVRQTGDMV